MKPIPTTNAMNPAPGKGITSFPTPVLNDVIVAEIVNSWKGDYQALEYGTKWDDVPHGSQQVSRPDHKLVFQTTISEDGQWVRRIWANDRVDQDTYNYAIKYSGGSPDHPIYIRTYVEPRDTYAPLPDNTPDPIYPSAVLVDEEVVRQEGELDSEYVQVVRVYETIPGPAITSKRVNERGDTETIVTQIVPPGTEPDPDGLLVTGTQVQQEDTSKGVKTTSTVESHSQLETKDKKEGLLGETTTTEDIVDPSTTPDTLSTSVIASTVQQVSATKAIKRTTTVSGPASLTQKSNDGKLLGDITITESIVSPSASPDSVSDSILSSEVRQTDSGKSIKRNTVLNSTPILLGNQKREGLLGETTSSESVVPAGESADDLTFSIISSAVEPIDSIRSRKVTITSSGPTSLSSSTLADSPVGKVEATLTTSIVPPETAAIGSINTIDDTIVPVDSARSRRETVSVDGYPQITTYEFDDVLGVPIIIEREVIPHSTPFEQKSLLIESQDRQIDKWKTLRITSRLSAIPLTRIEYKTQQFTFPAILTEVVVSDLNVGFGRIPVTAETTQYATGINKFVSVTPRLKPALSLPTRIRYVTSFHYGTAPAPEDIYQITTQFISYSGTLFSFNFGNVLTNGFTIGPIQANQNDPRYSGLNETITFAASIPTATEYPTGSEVVISSEVEYYRSNLWVKRTGYVTLA